MGAAIAAPSLYAALKPSSGSSRTKSVYEQETESNISREVSKGSPEKMRGLMLDAGRVPEKLEYYRRMVEFCAEWGFNTLQFRLADDQGSALRFTSVPGILTHKNAFTGDQLRSLAEYSRSRGVDMIPELESFGHTGF